MDITTMLNAKSPAAAVAAAAAEQQFQQQIAQSVSYPSPTSTTSPTDLQHPLSMLGPGYGEQSYENGFLPQQQERIHTQDIGVSRGSDQRQGSNGSVKAFACTTCGKGFARRSDLARHGKKFLQSSILVLISLARTYSQRRPPTRLS